MFSPDGTRLAFGRIVEGADPQQMDIVVANADGTQPLVITMEPIPVEDVRFEWAPDSRSLIVDAPDETGIWRYDATKTAPRAVVATEASFYLRPFQPPDGQRILIERHDGAMSRLIALDVVTGVETALAQGAGDELGSARWSADGSRVVYNASPPDDGVSERLYVVNADGTGTTQITHAPGVWYDIDAKYSPDGSRSPSPAMSASSRTCGSPAGRASTTSRRARSPRSARWPARCGSSCRAKAMRRHRTARGCSTSGRPTGGRCSRSRARATNTRS